MLLGACAVVSVSAGIAESGFVFRAQLVRGNVNALLGYNTDMRMASDVWMDREWAM